MSADPPHLPVHRHPDPCRERTETEIEAELHRLLSRVPPILRLPRPGSRCPYTGLARTSLVELIAPCPRNHHRPPVPVVPLKRNERARRGVYLIPAERLFRYLLTAVWVGSKESSTGTPTT